MKKIFTAIMLCLSLGMQAQTVVENAKQQLEEAKKAQKIAKQAIKEAKKAAKLQKKLAKIKAETGESTPTKTIPATPLTPAQKTVIPATKIEKPVTQPTDEGTMKKTTSDVKRGWIVPTAPTKAVDKKKETAVAAQQAEAQSYLIGAVPEVDGKVVFETELEANGKSAKEIYQLLYERMQELMTEDGQIDSRMALVNEDENVIAGKFKEWMVFSNNFLSVDRTEFNYILVAKCEDGRAHISMERMNYSYEADRPTGFKSSAEDLITDKKCLNKAGTKLVKLTGKFRRGTIDRKNEIFTVLAGALR
ncbi:hypothetical protein HMPREF3034_00628 [Prevotella sp. DNF00663]|uniref:DUF4468 domain-containing protein n=1 Tax=Prevotella sp. DNF00663 TaxID=1384078 RepID=UPI000781CDE7|nr:DUF4468 domain-containing protein [Prevotella sp. DNF00663]KXB84714.1 hypothetical protein HMPREF3034_00628 [Prevotella sp. DNF00663]